MMKSDKKSDGIRFSDELAALLEKMCDDAGRLRRKIAITPEYQSLFERWLNAKMLADCVAERYAESTVQLVDAYKCALR